MTDQRTTVHIGFETNTAQIDRAIRQIDRLKNKLDGLKDTGAVTTPVVTPRIQQPGGENQPEHQRSPRPQNSRQPSIPENKNIPGKGLSPRLMNFARRGGSAGLGAVAAFAGVGLGIGAVLSTSISLAKQYNQALDPVVKRLSIVGHGQDQFTKSLEKTGEAIGKNINEMLRLTQTYISYSGQQRGQVERQTRLAGLLSKGMGLDIGSTTMSMGGFAQMGAFGQYSTDNTRMERFALLIADAVAKGGMKGRETELFSSIQSLMNSQLNVLTRLAPGSTGNMLTLLTSMNQTGRPGLMGSRGGSLLGRVDAGIKHPQGELGEYFMYQALGGGNFFDFKLHQEEGIFGKGNWGKVMGYFKKNYKNPKTRHYAESQILGITMHQATALDNLKTEKGSGTDFMKVIGDVTGNDLSKITGDKYGIMTELYNAKGTSQRDELLKDTRIKDLAKEKHWTGQTDIKTILKGIAENSLKQTEPERMLTALATIDNEIIKLGNRLIPHLDSIFKEIETGIHIFTSDDEKENGQQLTNKVGQLGIDTLSRTPLFSKTVLDWLAPNPKDWKNPTTIPGITKNGENNKTNETLAGDLVTAFVPLVLAIDKVGQALGVYQPQVHVKVVGNPQPGDGNATKVIGGR